MKPSKIIIPIVAVIGAIFAGVFLIQYLVDANEEQWAYVTVDTNIESDIQEIKYGVGTRQIFVYKDSICNLYDYTGSYVHCKKIRYDVLKNKMGYYRFKINKYITEVDK